jgi:voltage-gated sodium channel
VEVVVKMGAEGNKPWRYFSDPWNVFDFIIVVACFLPFEGSAITVLRLLRLLRVLKLVKALPKLQILVAALLKSIPSMLYVSMLVGLLFYVYAVAAVFLFSENDPVHFKDLQIGMLSLFRIVTLEDWTDIMYINMFGCENYGYSPDSIYPCAFSAANPSGMSPLLGAGFFVSFVLMGTMIVLNLFIGVIMGGMTEAQEEAAQTQKIAERAARGEMILMDDELSKLREDLAHMQKHISTLERVARSIHPTPIARPRLDDHIDPAPAPAE